MLKHLLTTILLSVLLVNSSSAQFFPLGVGMEHGAYALLEFNGELHVCGAIDSAGGMPVNQMTK